MTSFDLNIERVLENWEIAHALREIIANALDEKLLTDTRDISIYKNGNNNWCVRDFGRGLHYEHLTQNESQEKLQHPNLVIGKFGVGLKDAFATLDRHHIKTLIKSKYGNITLEKLPKNGFNDIITLHAIISTPSDLQFEGTEFIFEGIQDSDMQKAKDFFLVFSAEQLLETTQYGQVFKRTLKGGRIYINGMYVAEEENFLFSYNITSLTQAMRKALNRERSHIGRTAYKDRVESILLGCGKKETAQLLVEDLKEFDSGKSHEELKWVNIATHACKLLNALQKVIFLTSSELLLAKDMVDRATRDGYVVNIVPGNVKEKISGMQDLNDNPIRDLSKYVTEWNNSFKYQIISPDKLNGHEMAIFNKADSILKLIRGKPLQVKAILISETMRLEGYQEAVGVWEKVEQRIIIKRSQLKRLEDFAGTLLHELAHARSGEGDISREFERELTNLLGLITATILSQELAEREPARQERKEQQQAWRATGCCESCGEKLGLLERIGGQIKCKKHR